MNSTSFKHPLLIFILIALAGSAFGQNVKRDTSFTFAEIRFGYGTNYFGEGLSEDYEAGNFSSSGGFLATLAAYHKFKKINHTVIGMKYKSLGAAPSKGDNGREMFFNYWGVAVSARYFPFHKMAHRGLFVQADYFFITQFTQKYRSTANLEFNHQFAIGSGYAVGIGYALDLPTNRKNRITIGIEYEQDNRRGEVSGIGDKTFASSNLAFLVGFIF
jgi:hypothetical protein